MFYIWTPKQQNKTAQPKGDKRFTSGHQNSRTKQLNQKELSVLHLDTKKTAQTAQPKGDVLHQDTKIMEQNSSARRRCFTSGHQNSRTKQLNQTEMFYIRTLKQQNKTAQPEGDVLHQDTKTAEQNSSTKRR